MSTTQIHLDVDGRQVRAAFAPASGPTGVVVIHEFWGLNAHIESVAARFAQDGVPAIAVDLYGGHVAQSREEAAQRMAALDYPTSMRIIAAAAAELRRHGARKVATLGFCMGGAVALASAAQAEGLDGAVVFYGIPSEFDASAVRVPVLAHYANTDAWCTPEAVNGVEQALQGAGKSCALYRYDAAHAFFNDTREGIYDAEKAQLARERTLQFLADLVR